MTDRFCRRKKAKRNHPKRQQRNISRLASMISLKSNSLVTSLASFFVDPEEKKVDTNSLDFLRV